MITCTLRGRMGNQMFIIATTIATALRNNTVYTLPEKSGKRNQFDNYFIHLPKMQPWNGRDIIDPLIYTERIFGTYMPIPNEVDIHLQGYFQSELYFKDYRKQVIEAFNLTQYKTRQGVVSVHVRRGDYVRLNHKHPPVSIEYLLQAMNYFVDDGYQFEFFSDDIEWCKANFKGSHFQFNNQNDPKQAMAEMAACEHNIIANSTFSWWAAWLNSNPDKVVIAPKQWFSDKYPNKDKDIIPKNWIRL